MGVKTARFARHERVPPVVRTILLSVRWFFGTYILLLTVSVIGVGQRTVQMMAAVLWVVGMLSLLSFVTAGRNQVARRRVLPTEQSTLLTAVAVGIGVLLSQFPGMLASSMSLWAAVYGSMNEWANGLLELWVSPFLPWLERLPAHSIHHFSVTYLAACCTPFVLVLLFGAWSLGSFVVCSLSNIGKLTGWKD